MNDAYDNIFLIAHTGRYTGRNILIVIHSIPAFTSAEITVPVFCAPWHLVPVYRKTKGQWNDIFIKYCPYGI